MSNLIVTLTGPSCGGKSTLERMMCEQLGFERVISTTTRHARAGELNGDNYCFTDKSQFKRLKEQGYFVESVKFNGNYYGVSVKEVERVFATGKNVVIVVEPSGKNQIEEYVAKHSELRHLPLFVDCPPEVISERFLNRFLNEVIKETVAAEGKAVLTYSARLAEMLSTEAGWVVGSKVPGAYRMVVQKFDQFSTQAVLNSIKNLIHSGVQQVN